MASSFVQVLSELLCRLLPREEVLGGRKGRGGWAEFSRLRPLASVSFHAMQSTSQPQPITQFAGPKPEGDYNRVENGRYAGRP